MRQDLPLIPLGQMLPVQAFRCNLAGVVAGGPAVFWDVRRV